MSADFETNITSVERIKEYFETPHEDEWRIEKTKPVATWPESGHISFDAYSVKYREELDDVLRSLSLDVLPAEKIGIVGRTGAGKSSLTLALFRILEHSRGSILIDGVDIKTIGLHDLRHKITIIPQVYFLCPFFFSTRFFLSLTNSWTSQGPCDILGHNPNESGPVRRLLGRSNMEGTRVGPSQRVCHEQGQEARIRLSSRRWKLEVCFVLDQPICLCLRRVQLCEYYCVVWVSDS